MLIHYSTKLSKRINLTLRHVINEHIDLVWQDNKPVILVDNMPFVHCSFLAASIPIDEATRVSEQTPSIDAMVHIEGARSMEGIDALAFGMTPEEIMIAHSSNLIAWVENDYNTRILASNLSFPLLKELARVGDDKARRVLQGDIIDRLKEGNTMTTIAILKTCDDIMDEEAFRIAAKSDNHYVKRLVWSSKFAPNDLQNAINGKSFASEDKAIIIIGVSRPFDMMKNQRYAERHPEKEHSFAFRIYWIDAETQEAHLSFMSINIENEAERYMDYMFKIIDANIIEFKNSNGEIRYSIGRASRYRVRGSLQIDQIKDMLERHPDLRYDGTSNVELMNDLGNWKYIIGQCLHKHQSNFGTVFRIIGENDDFNTEPLSCIVHSSHASGISEGDEVIATGDVLKFNDNAPMMHVTSIIVSQKYGLFLDDILDDALDMEN